ncbi:conserved hypothetical protein [Burkholderia mallei PRL-20]|nr:hypothetical protein BMASAVP1_A2854 [Burkholderia mallei SAVP1]ABO04138.1 hypothetical protein BMA10247_2477 [Burkholderia mallei NCTC 10247]EEP86950.1 conserved hypothetical protein [Burkholderia mallei GB8 horse 4]EES45199.1 conserved hypothetical protein [Burkholderia mallei PRL-20]
MNEATPFARAQLSRSARNRIGASKRQRLCPGSKRPRRHALFVRSFT